MNRRDFLAQAAALGATAAWRSPRPASSSIPWRERRDLFPEGVASGDPDSTSVLLWTRRPPGGSKPQTRLTVEVAEDPEFRRVIARTGVTLSEAADWTCRVLVGGLKPSRIYYYRFSDAEGMGSRIGRTRTAPADDDGRPVRFAFVSCQNVNYGGQNAYRRMIFEDAAAREDEQLGFVLHLGDFIYELVWYPEDRPQGMYDRRIREILRYPDGEKIDDFHIPTTVAGYRAVYRAYLHDPDIQDARARFPFITMWDNHEFSWLGWQGIQLFDGKTRPAQTRKVAANQAFFEFQPARLVKPNGGGLETFNPPKVQDVPVTTFDTSGLGTEANNLAAIRSLQGYRALRWGRHVDLIITDQHSYRSEDPGLRPEITPLSLEAFPELIPEQALQILDGGRQYADSNPPEAIHFGDITVPNFRRDQPPQTILGAEQKRWFLARLGASRATWKIWGNSQGSLDMRADPQNLPTGLTQPWPGGFASFGGGDWSSAFAERREIYDFVKSRGIAGFVTVAGDRHSFWAGLAAAGLPPQRFDPIGIAFITGSLSAPGMVEAIEHGFPKQHPLRSLYLGQAAADRGPQPTVNMMIRHGVKSCLEYAASGDVQKARALSNPDLSPHLSFVDMGGHGYAVVTASAEAL
ncbi:MAG: alkaline phosphatase D family protein, partial [Gemmatimonadota bacterium]